MPSELELRRKPIHVNELEVKRKKEPIVNKRVENGEKTFSRERVMQKNKHTLVKRVNGAK